MPNIAKLVLKGLKSQAKTVGLRSATLIKTTAGSRTVGSLADGPGATTTSYQCKALIELLTVDDMPGTLVTANDRKIGILGASLSVVPSINDSITIKDIDGVTKTMRLTTAVSGDGVGAMYEFTARV
jgi:hypothetical protein